MAARMDETARQPPHRRPRERPTHWRHPVDEPRRLARARAWRRRRVAALVALVLAGALAVAYLHLTSDPRIRQFARTYMQEMFGARVEMSRATFSLLAQGVVLEDLRMYPPPPYEDPILAADRVDLRVDLLALVQMRLEVSEIVVRRPRVTLVLWDEKQWNFQALAAARPGDLPRLDRRPVLALEEGTLSIRRKVAGEAIYEHEMQISGLLIPNEEDPHTARFQTVVSGAGVRLSVMSGLLDARTGALGFEAAASNVALTPELYRALPREVQQVWERFEPTGSVNLHVHFDETGGLRVRTDLTGVRFVYEYAGLEHRFENLTGRATFTPRRLDLENVQGLLDGSPMRLEGTVEGFDRDALAADLSVQAEQVPLEEHRAALLGLSPDFASLYEHYAPRGLVDVAVRLRRDPDGSRPPVAEGTVTLRDVAIAYDKFPYPIQRLRGPVRFGAGGYRAEGLQGVHGQSPITITSVVTNPGPAYGLEATIRGRAIPVDADLRGALTGPQREAFDQYDPSGTMDLDVSIKRDPAAGAPLRTEVEARLAGCTVKYRGFPYLLTDVAGQVHITAERAEIRQVRGRHGPAEVEIRGEILPQPGPDPQVRLELTGRRVPIDEDLEAALPPRERESFKAFHLAGRADIEGTVQAGPKTPGLLDYRLAVRLAGGRMIYEMFPFLAEDLAGTVHLAPGRCRIEALTAYNAGARLRTSGWIDHRPDDFAMDLAVEGEDVPLSEQLRGALGPEVRAAWGHLAPQGRVDIQAHLRKALGPKEPVLHEVRVRPRGISARLDFFSYPLEQVQGLLEFVGDEVRLADLKGRSGPTEFAISGRVRYTDAGPEIDVTVGSQGLRLEGPLRSAAPQVLGPAFDRLKPTGRVDFRLDPLRYRPGPAAEAAWTANVLLDEVAIRPGIRISQIVGTTRMTGRWTPGELALDGELWIQQGKIAGQPVTNTRLRFQKEAASPNLVFPTIEGEFYGGRLEGRATLLLGRPGAADRYAFSLAVKDVDFDRLVRDGLRLDLKGSGGRLSATMALESRGPDAVAAAGYARITRAALYELPPILRTLAALRFAADDQTAFREASVKYFMLRGKVVLEDIRLEGPNIGLYGAGTVDAGGRLYLTFTTGRKDDKPLVGALADLRDGLRHELLVVEVTGTMRDPQVEARPLSALTAPLRELVDLVRESRSQRR